MGTIYEDDGETFQYREGKYWEESICVRKEERNVQVEFEKVHRGYKPYWDNLMLKIHGTEEPVDIWVNGKKAEDTSLAIVDGTVTVHVPFS